LDTTLRFPEDFDKYYKGVFDFPRAIGEGNEEELKNFKENRDIFQSG